MDSPGTAAQGRQPGAALSLRRLVFAGEHVSTAFFGFMEDALHSGEMAAERVLALASAAAAAGT